VEARTLGEFVVQEGVLEALREAVPQIIAQATREAKTVGKQQLRVVSCTKCAAPKTCCSSIVVARLYEGVVVAAHLRDAGRDTPELRAELAAAATAMEAASPYAWRVPCVFLDTAERCTVYPARPTPCGTLLVYSPAAACSDPAAVIEAYVAESEQAAATALEEMFRARLALRKKVGRRYLGVLPRMVLLALEVWDRTDFRDVLRAHAWPTDAEVARWNRAPA
jgi:Fe-S-cluster containining protein